jgi:hypothetical protein
MAKNTKNKEILEIHGKQESVNRVNTALSLDEILGENLSIYTAKSSEEYEGQLAEMNQTDLQAHAYKVGLVPVPDRKILCDRLTHEFQKWNSRYSGKNPTQGISRIEDISDKAKKILREGA